MVTTEYDDTKKKEDIGDCIFLCLFLLLPTFKIIMKCLNTSTFFFAIGRESEGIGSNDLEIKCYTLNKILER